MNIVLSKPLEVEALRWACNQIRMRSATLTADAGKLAALDAITDPTLAADLLRRLLERCGADTEIATGPTTTSGYRECTGPHTHVYVQLWRTRWVIPIERVPRLVSALLDLGEGDDAGRLLDIALLDAPNRAAALAVLRGER